MPPMAHARFPKTVKRKLVEPPKKITPATKMAFKLSDLRPWRRYDSPAPLEKLTINPIRKLSRAWPPLMIQKSTRIFGQIPAVNNYESNQNDVPMPAGYFFEKSEVEISPVDNIIREKRYSLKTFFDDLSNNAFSRHEDTRFRHRNSEELEKGEKEEEEAEGYDQADNVSRLLAILTRNRREDSMRKESFRHRSKRQASEDDVREEIEEPEAKERERVGVDDTKTQRNGRRKSGYTPVFNECNDTAAASEVSDLNAPPPPPERRSTLQEYSRNGGPLLRDIDFVPKKNPPIVNRRKNEDSEVHPSVPPAVDEEEVLEAAKEAASTSKNTQNGTYINLQDHQKGTQDGKVPKDANGYPLDIPPYNPDVIPYVDVPDYTDQREESLDKDDRRVAKERYVEYPDEDADVIDPGVPLKSDQRSEEIIVRDEDVSSDRDEATEAPNDSKSRGAEEATEEEKEVEEEVKDEDESSRISNENDENAEEEKEIEETNSKDIRNPESDDVKDFEPVHFDISEYKKPFDLEELFKDIRLEAEKAQKKNKTKGSAGDVNEHQSSKNIPVRDDGHEVFSDASKKYQDDGEFKLLNLKGPAKKAHYEHQDSNNKRNAPQDGTITPPNFFEEFERVFGPATSETPFTGFFETADEDDKEGLPGSSAGLVESEDEKYPYGDENTYERLFGAGDEENKDDDDAAGFNSKEKAPEIEAEEPTDESLRKAYKTLATILDRKDDISRLDDEVAQKAKKEGKMPAKYNNYWSLEYGSPVGKGET